MYNKAEISGRLCNLANQLLANEIDIVSASRTINKLRFSADPEDELFLIFRAIDSDTDDYPVLESQRDLWNRESLKKLDEEVSHYLESVKPQVYEACREIIKRFHP